MVPTKPSDTNLRSWPDFRMADENGGSGFDGLGLGFRTSGDAGTGEDPDALGGSGHEGGPGSDILPGIVVAEAQEQTKDITQPGFGPGNEGKVGAVAGGALEGFKLGVGLFKIGVPLGQTQGLQIALGGCLIEIGKEQIQLGGVFIVSGGLETALPLVQFSLQPIGGRLQLGVEVAGVGADGLGNKEVEVVPLFVLGQFLGGQLAGGDPPERAVQVRYQGADLSQQVPGVLLHRRQIAVEDGVQVARNGAEAFTVDPSDR